jgi:riboflavin synthase
VFTGLIEEAGVVKNIERKPDGMVFTIGAESVLEGTKNGDSIAVNGACLTVTALGRGDFSVFASRVTCDVTTLGSFTRGRRVHLERALTLSSRLGGHLVQAHVDGRGSVSVVKKDSSGLEITIAAPPDIMKHLVPRGSVAVDGVSLTVVSLVAGGFVIYLIPETMGNTALAELKNGDEVNIETDILAKYVEKMLGDGKGGGERDSSLLKKLMEGGFA